MTPETLFLIKFFLTNIVFSLIIGLALVRMQTIKAPDAHSAPGELIFLSLGLGPAVTVLLLYFILLLLPGKSHYFYFGAVWGFYIAIVAFGAAGYPQIFRSLRTSGTVKIASFRAAPLSQKLRGAATALIPILAIVLFFQFFGHVKKVPIEGHDILIYGNIGKYYFQEKKVAYRDYIYNPENGFFFPASPKPAFSLLLTWELLLNECTPGYSAGETARLSPLAFDLYFRSISGYYALLLVVLILYRLRLEHPWLAIGGAAVLTASLQFMLMFFNHHLDSFRIFFFCASLLLLSRAIRHNTPFNLFLLGMFSGFTAFIHLTGAAAALLIAAAFLVFSRNTLRHKIRDVLILIGYILLFGGMHYFLEAFFGARFGFHTYL